MAKTLDLDRRIDAHMDRLLELVADQTLEPEQRRHERLRLLGQILSDSDERLARKQEEIKARQGRMFGSVERELYRAERATRSLQRTARTLAHLDGGGKGYA